MFRRGYIIIILMVIGMFVNAENLKQCKLDSLKECLIGETDPGILADTYSGLAEYWSDNFDSSLTYSHKYLRAATAANNPVNIAKAYCKIADTYYYSNYDSTLLYVQLYLEESLKTNDTALIADGYNFLAYVYNQKGELLASLENYQEALDYYTILKDSINIASCFINIGYSLSFGNEQVRALKFFLNGLHLSEEIHDTVAMSDTHYNIAFYYYQTKDYPESFRHYEKALDLRLNSSFASDSISISMIYGNMANVSLKFKQNENFESLIKLTKDMIPVSSTNFDKAYVYSIILDSYIEQKNLDSSRHYLGLIEPILEKNDFDLLKAYAYQYKGRILFLEKQYDESIRFLNKSIELFNKNKSIETFSETCKHIARAYAALNMDMEAYLWQVKADSFKDSLDLGAVERELTEYEQKNIREIELQRNKLKMELEQQKILNTNIHIRSKLRLSIAALILLSAFIVVVIFYYRTTRKNNAVLSNKNKLIEEQKLLLEKQVIKLEEDEKKLQELNATKDKFFSIIAHDLRNPLQSIISLSGLFLEEGEPVKPNDITKILASMNKTANYGVSLLENLLAWSRSQTGNIVPVPVKLEMDRIIQHLILDFKIMAESKHIFIDFQAEALPFVFADKNMIITVARNLLHNAIKFSYENSVIRISITRINNELITSIRDEGIGMTEEEAARLFRIDNPVKKSGTHKETGSGLGLILCKEFVEKNGGKLRVDREQEKGCSFHFSLPVYKEK